MIPPMLGTLGMVLATVFTFDQPAPTPDPGAAPLIVIELVVQDFARRPITNLGSNEVEVTQDAERQPLVSFRPLHDAGRYEITYKPLSGKPGAVTVRLLRQGALARGPEGGPLKPHVVPAPSPLEASLERVLEARPDAADLGCRIAVLHYESRSDGVHQTIAVEVPSSELRHAEGQVEEQRHLQILARIKDAEGRVVRRIALDRPLEAAGVARVDAPAFERLVWTGHLHLAAGSYEIETLVFEPASGRAATKRTALPLTAAGDGGLEVSSVALLQARGFLFLADPAPDDPLVVNGEAVMPTLDLEVPAGSDSKVRFFVTVYPDAKSPEQPSLTLELRRDDQIVGTVPLQLPQSEPSGEIRFVGLMPTRSFKTSDYVLKVVARQGAQTASEDARFKVVPATEP
jgi:hypothetical protein